MKRVFLGAAVVALLAGGGCSKDATQPDVATLQVTDVVVGTGAEAVAGKTVTVQYTGWLYEQYTADHHGTKFDSSYDRNQPFQFVLGAGNVIKGWDQGVVGMKVGGKRTLIIPSSLAYGSTGSGPIPGGRALVFDIELLNVQ